MWLRKVLESRLISTLIGEKGSGFNISFFYLIVPPTLVSDALTLISGRVLLNSSKSDFFKEDIIAGCLGVSIDAISPSWETSRVIWSSSCFNVLSVRLFVSRNCETSSPIIYWRRDFIAGVFCDSGSLSLNFFKKLNVRRSHMLDIFFCLALTLMLRLCCSRWESARRLSDL